MTFSREVNNLSLRVIGKPFAHLNGEERKRLQDHPLWLPSMYGMPRELFQSLFRKENKMLVKEWADEVDIHDDVGYEGIFDNISKRAWEFFHERVENNLIFRIFGVVGKIRNIFTEIFGEDYWKEV